MHRVVGRSLRSRLLFGIAAAPAARREILGLAPTRTSALPHFRTVLAVILSFSPTPV
jgi:hypothetical protein